MNLTDTADEQKDTHTHTHAIPGNCIYMKVSRRKPISGDRSQDNGSLQVSDCKRTFRGAGNTLCFDLCGDYVGVPKVTIHPVMHL